MAEIERARYTASTDAIYVYLPVSHGEYFRTTDFGDGVMLDYDRDRVIFGVEFMNASRGVSLEGIPNAQFVAEAIREVCPAALGGRSR